MRRELHGAAPKGGNPVFAYTLCDAYTKEQYKDAGFEFVEVLSNSAPECHELGGNSLADYLHTVMETERVQKKLEIAINGSESHTYQSRGAAEHMAEEVFTSTYEQAAAYFDPNHDDCIAGTTAVEYANTLQEKIVNASLKMSVFAEKECPFSPDSIQVYTALTTTLLVGLKPVKP